MRNPNDDFFVFRSKSSKTPMKKTMLGMGALALNTVRAEYVCGHGHRWRQITGEAERCPTCNTSTYESVPAVRAEPSPEGEPSKEAVEAAIAAGPAIAVMGCTCLWDDEGNPPASCRCDELRATQLRDDARSRLRAAYAVDSPARSTERADDLGEAYRAGWEAGHAKVWDERAEHEAALAEARAEVERLREIVCRYHGAIGGTAYVGSQGLADVIAAEVAIHDEFSDTVQAAQNACRRAAASPPEEGKDG